MKTSKPPAHLSTGAPSAALALIIGLTASPAWANPQITGNLTVKGNFTVEGEVIRIDNGTNPFELRLGTNRIDFWHDAPGQWVWSHGATPTDVMSLDSNNILSLYDLGAASVNPSIILSPGNPDASPAIPPSISIGGNPVITSANAASILGSQGYLRVVDGVLHLPSTTPATSSTTGALTVAGGLGVAKDTWINGIRIGRGNSDVSTNTAIGTLAVHSNSLGIHNTATGYASLHRNTTGNQNTATGSHALLSNTTGVRNTASGVSSLYFNTTGSRNTATGSHALSGNTTGSGNSATGIQSLHNNTTGSNNSAIGIFALHSNIAGSSNVAIGASSGRYQADGTTPLAGTESSVYIGADSRGKDDADSNSIVIGANAIGEGANTTVIGNSDTTTTRLYGETNVTELRITGGVVIEQPQGDISMGAYQ